MPIRTSTGPSQPRLTMDSQLTMMQDIAMPISEKNAIRAIKQVGLDQPGPIRADVKDALIVKAARLAEYYDRMDAVMGPGWDDLRDITGPICVQIQNNST